MYNQVSPTCAGHVKRVMHVRATSVKLMPEIEDACRKELGDKCGAQTKEGEVSLHRTIYIFFLFY